jgi:ribosomal-protein-alanine N-acetyltransferase
VSQIIAEFTHDFLDMRGLTCAMILKEDDSYIGTCGYGTVEINHRGKIGFDLSKELWGTGLMMEALSAIIGYRFKTLNLARVEAHTYSNNVRAVRLLDKLGFELDSVSEDSSYFSLLKESWKGVCSIEINLMGCLTSRWMRPGKRRDL